MDACRQQLPHPTAVLHTVHQPITLALSPLDTQVESSDTIENVKSKIQVGLPENEEHRPFMQPSCSNNRDAVLQTALLVFAVPRF